MVSVLKQQLHETWSILRSFKGNARGCLIAEPFWGIPYNLYVPYVSIYMLALGCTETQIGLIISVGLVFQMFFTLISGHITDKMGRKKTSLVFDLLGWSTATLIWAFAQNFYYFLAAALVNSIYRIVHTSWSCLAVEDTKPEDRVHLYTWIYVAGILAGFFAPLSGLLVKQLTLVPAVRILYLLAFVSMTFMFFLRDRLTHETTIGLQKMKETKNLNPRETLGDYKRVFLELFKSPLTITAFLLAMFHSIQVTLRSTFHSILLTKGLQLPEASISVFPAIGSAVMLFMYIFVMPVLRRYNHKASLAAGIAFMIAGNLILLLSPAGGFGMVALSTIVSGIGMAVVAPYIDSLLANSIPDEDRAKVMAILYVILLGATAPSGYIGGVLSSISEKLPFTVIGLTLVVNLLLVWLYGKLEKKQVKSEAVGV